jgi:hypothetical protein
MMGGPPPHIIPPPARPHPMGDSHMSYGAPPPMDTQSHAVQGRWEEATAANGDKYYWHTITKETSWTDPRAPVAPPVAPPAPPAPAPSTSQWEVAMDEHGDKYYWNTVTGATQWEPPPGFVEKRPPAPGPTATARFQQQPRQYAPMAKGPGPSPGMRGIQRLG